MQRNVKGSKWSRIKTAENQQFNHKKVMQIYKKRHFGRLYIYPIILGNLSYTSRMGSRYDFKREAKVYTTKETQNKRVSRLLRLPDYKLPPQQQKPAKAKRNGNNRQV